MSMSSVGLSWCAAPGTAQRETSRRYGGTSTSATNASTTLPVGPSASWRTRPSGAPGAGVRRFGETVPSTNVSCLSWRTRECFLCTFMLHLSSLAHDFNGTKPIFVDFPGATVRSNMFCLIFPQGALVEEPAYHLLRKNRR
jgi:hypothetical protein